jgi:hypothetical protein
MDFVVQTDTFGRKKLGAEPAQGVANALRLVRMHQLATPRFPHRPKGFWDRLTVSWR